jgi:hypothetical protein
MWLALSLVLVSTGAVPSSAETGITGFYRGTIGKRLVVGVSLREASGSVSGYYFYAKVGTDIPLKGTIQPTGDFDVEELDANGKATGRWVGRIALSKQTATPELSGTWRDPKTQKRLSFSLSRVEPAAAGPDASHRLKAGDAEHEEIVVGPDLSYRTTAIAATGFQFPRLTHFRDAAIAGAVNAAIDKAVREFPCGAPEGDNTQDVDAAVTYAAHDILSIFASLSFNCGGPYPTVGQNVSMTFDLETGKEVRFRALFRRDAGLDDILKAVFPGPIQRAARLSASGAEDSDDCAKSTFMSLENLRDSKLAFHLTPDRIVVQPVDWPHAIEACAERVDTPYARLQKLVNPSGILSRVESAAP